MGNKYFKNVVFIKSCLKKEDFLLDKPAVCFLGRSNVGKSTLINQITNTKRLMKTSKTPGLTRFVNYALVDKMFYLCDSPGYGYASLDRDHFDKLMSSYLECKNLKKIYILIDSRRLLSNVEVEFADGLKVPYSYIFTKYDKLSGNEKYDLKKQIEMLENEKIEYFITSSIDNSSLEKVRLDIIKAVSRG